VTLIFDLLTLRVERFMALSRESLVPVCITSSSAVAERPRDAFCPSAVSLHKIVTRAESFIIVT